MPLEKREGNREGEKSRKVKLCPMSGTKFVGMNAYREPAGVCQQGDESAANGASHSPHSWSRMGPVKTPDEKEILFCSH